jgi:hypothetical protein
MQAASTTAAKTTETQRATLAEVASSKAGMPATVGMSLIFTSNSKDGSNVGGYPATVGTQAMVLDGRDAYRVANRAEVES